MSVAEKIKTPNNEIIQPKKMGLLVENPVYKPFRYPWCYDAWLTPVSYTHLRANDTDSYLV